MIIYFINTSILFKKNRVYSQLNLITAKSYSSYGFLISALNLSQLIEIDPTVPKHLAIASIEPIMHFYLRSSNLGYMQSPRKLAEQFGNY